MKTEKYWEGESGPKLSHDLGLYPNSGAISVIEAHNFFETPQIQWLQDINDLKLLSQ